MCEGRQYNLLLLDKERFALVDVLEDHVVAETHIERVEHPLPEKRFPRNNLKSIKMRMNSVVQPKRRGDNETVPSEGSPNTRSKPGSSMNKMERSERVARSALNMVP